MLFSVQRMGLELLRGYRDHDYLLRKLRFMVANPIRANDGIRRFIALGLTPPMPLGQVA